MFLLRRRQAHRGARRGSRCVVAARIGSVGELIEESAREDDSVKRRSSRVVARAEARDPRSCDVRGGRNSHVPTRCAGSLLLMPGDSALPQRKAKRSDGTRLPCTPVHETHTHTHWRHWLHHRRTTHDRDIYHSVTTQTKGL